MIENNTLDTKTPIRNTEWTICITSPLLRPGLEIKSGPISGKYVVEETLHALEMVREINSNLE